MYDEQCNTPCGGLEFTPCLPLAKLQGKKLSRDLLSIIEWILLVHEAACHSGKTSFVAYMCSGEKDPRW
jgi:hypothetical protein